MSVTTLSAARGTAPAGPVFQPTSFAELMKFAEVIQHSDLLPRDYKGKPGNIVLAVQMGSEVGLSLMQAIQGIAVINGRPAIWGDAMMGLVRQSPNCENISERIEGDGDARTAICIAKRRGADPITSRFSIGDAKRAGLFNKQGPWTQYPDRMLAQRARGFALRDAFADVLKGLKSVEEVRDYAAPHREPPHSGPTLEARAEPARSMDDTLSGDAIPTASQPGPSFGNRADRVIDALPSVQTPEKLAVVQTKAAALLDELEQAGRLDLRDRLLEAFSTARARMEPPGDDDFPGDRP